MGWKRAISAAALIWATGAQAQSVAPIDGSSTAQPVVDAGDDNDKEARIKKLLTVDREPDSDIVSKFGVQVYRALQDSKPEASGAYMRDAINSLGGICPNVSSYQRVGPATKLMTYKVQCGKRPIYLLTVDEVGRMLADGGDGRVPAMNAAEGQIYKGDGDRGYGLADASGRSAKGDNDNNDEIPLEAVNKSGPVAVTSVGAMDGKAKVLPYAAGFILVVSVIGAAIMYLRFNGPNGMAPRASNAPRRYPSELKDQMIAESPEILPDVWAHQSGIYIVRGRHGKRRVFKKRWQALLYHRYGYKVMQVR